MTLKTTFCSFAAIAFLATSSHGFAQEGFGPGPEMKKLDDLVGTWEAEMVAQGQTSKGVMTYRKILNGMWIESDFKGDFAGIPFTGRGMDSYDSTKKKYVSVWMDSMTGTPSVFHGDFDESGKVLTMVAESQDDAGNPVKMKSVATTVDKDHTTFTMIMIAGDQEIEMMTINYARRK